MQIVIKDQKFRSKYKGKWDTYVGNAVRVRADQAQNQVLTVKENIYRSKVNYKNKFIYH